MKKIIATLVFALLLSTHALANDPPPINIPGCIDNNEGPKKNYVYFLTLGNGDYDYNHPTKFYGAGMYCILNQGPIGSCNLSNGTTGTQAQITYYELCDLDTNTWVLLSLTIIPAFFYRKKLFLNKI